MLRRLVTLALLASCVGAPAWALEKYPAGVSTETANTWVLLQTFSAGLTVSGGNLIAPTIIGGTGTTSTLTLQSTSGVGAAGADIVFKVGNNGGTEAGRFSNNGDALFGTTTSLAKVTVVTSGDTAGYFQSDNFPVVKIRAPAYSLLRFNVGGTNEWDFGSTASLWYLYDLDNAAYRLVAEQSTGFIALGGITTPASLLDLRAGDLTFSGANGQKYVQGRATQLVAVGSGISTKATTIQIPADAIVYAVPVYVKTKPGGTATMTVTSTTSGTAFQKGANISTNAGTSDPGTKNTPINYNAVAAQTVTFTFDVPTTDALGEIRVDVYYATSTPPTS